MRLLSGLLKLLRSVLGKQSTPSPPGKPTKLAPDRSALVAALDDSPYGVNCHTAAPDMIATLAEGGIRWYRVDIDWDRIERQQGVTDWLELDTTVEALRQRGLCLLGSIAYTPAWASGSEPTLPREARQGRMPLDPERFLLFIDGVLKRYPGTFQAFAVWNEPNQEKYFRGTRDEYLKKLLRPGLERLRNRAPQVVRCGPDLSSSPTKSPHRWLTEVLDTAGELIDVVTHHQYDGGETVDGRLRQIEEISMLLTKCGYSDRQLWITETGWKRGEVTDEEQAEHLAEMIKTMLSRRDWWKKTFWFDSHAPGEGLLGPDESPDRGQPYPVFRRYVSVIQAHRR